MRNFWTAVSRLILTVLAVSSLTSEWLLAQPPAEQLPARWWAPGDDRPFAACDGMNCPDLTPGDPGSHSLLLERGLFRIPLPWPPVDAQGSHISPEFEIEVVRDPTGCNTHPVYGIEGQNREVSVYRRPRPAANLRFYLQLYAAQAFSNEAGVLDETGGPSGLGPRAMAAGRDGVLGNNTTQYVIPMEDRWADLPEGRDAAERAHNSFRESSQRGHDVFYLRTFWISDAMHINTVGLGNPIKRTCSTCHGMHMAAMDTANGWMDLGTTNHPWALEPPESPWAEALPELPLFRITCRKDLPPHPFLGREIYTQDPGRALISGKYEAVGAIVIQQFRGLAARAPYFSNGSARTLHEVVDFYDRRFLADASRHGSADTLSRQA